MNKELEIWRFAAERLKLGESVILLVVAESLGSSPGRQGFKMIVARDEMRGSIGGGVMEMRLAEQARLQIQNENLRNNAQIVEQIHRKNAANPSGMICSGKQTVIFFRLDSSHSETVNQIIFSLEKHQSKILQISNSAFALEENAAENFDFHFARKSRKEFAYGEKLGCKNKLFIVGGGHCALALSELMAKMDFHISLFDDRKDLNTIAKNNFADRKIVLESYETIGEFIPSGANHFVVVMTLGYKFDEIVIRQLIDKDFKYFGVLGSRAKMKTLLKSLAGEGFAETKLNRIRTPIGLPINSRTPEEIAVSIAAEIIHVKNKLI